MKYLRLLASILLVLALAACGENEEVDQETSTSGTNTDEPSESEESNATEESSDSEEAEQTGEVIEVEIKASNFEFDVKEVQANVGDTIKLTLENSAGAHGLAIDEFNVDVKGDDTVEFVVDKAGEFQYYCSVMCGAGHDKMVGTLVVSE